MSLTEGQPAAVGTPPPEAALLVAADVVAATPPHPGTRSRAGAGSDTDGVETLGATDQPPGGRPEEPSDAALVRRARLGDEEAFSEIVERHGPPMYRYARRMVGSEADAAEVTQDAFVSAWRSLGTFAGRSSLKTWLIRLVHRRAVDLHRVRRPTPINDDLLTVLVRPAADNPLQHVMDDELRAALQQALDELPWHQRATWLLREVEGMSYDEIAAALGLPLGSVRGHLQRSRKNLAERLARWR